MQNSRRAYVNLALATTAFAVAFAAWSMISPLSHQIQADLNLDNTVASVFRLRDREPHLLKSNTIFERVLRHASQQKRPAHVSGGSLSDILLRSADVRFNPVRRYARRTLTWVAAAA